MPTTSTFGRPIPTSWIFSTSAPTKRLKNRPLLFAKKSKKVGLFLHAKLFIDTTFFPLTEQKKCIFLFCETKPNFLPVWTGGNKAFSSNRFFLHVSKSPREKEYPRTKKETNHKVRFLQTRGFYGCNKAESIAASPSTRSQLSRHVILKLNFMPRIVRKYRGGIWPSRPPPIAQPVPSYSISQSSNLPTQQNTGANRACGGR